MLTRRPPDSGSKVQSTDFAISYVARSKRDPPRCERPLHRCVLDYYARILECQSVEPRAVPFPDNNAAGHRRHFIAQSSSDGLNPQPLIAAVHKHSNYLIQSNPDGAFIGAAMGRLLTHSSPSQLCSFPQSREPNERRPLRLAFPQRPRSLPSILVARRRAVVRPSYAP